MNRGVIYEEKIKFYFSDYEEALELGKKIGLKVFLGVELSYKGTDFLIYGLDKEWFLAHPEILEMKRRRVVRRIWKIRKLKVSVFILRPFISFS